MQSDMHSLEHLARTGDFSPILLLFLIIDTCCLQMLLHFFCCLLIRYNTTVPALREPFVYSPSLLDALLLVSDELRFQLSVLCPLIVVVLLCLLVQRMDCAMVT